MTHQWKWLRNNFLLDIKENFQIIPVGSRRMALKDMQSLTPGTCISAALQGRRDPADVIKSRILRWGDWSGLSGGSNAAARLLIRGEAKSIRAKQRSERDVRMLHCWLRKQRKVLQAKECRWVSGSWRGPRNRFSLRTSRRNTALTTPGF